MRAVVQRVTDADVSVENQVKGSIGRGFVVLLGVEEGDNVTLKISDTKRSEMLVTGIVENYMYHYI